MRAVERSPSGSRRGRPMNCRTPFPCSTACPACRPGWLRIGATPHIINRFDLKPRIERLLLANRADRIAFVVVGWEDQGLVWQLQQLAKKRLVLRARVAVLEIRSSRPPDQQRIPREHPIQQEEAVGIIR